MLAIVEIGSTAGDFRVHGPARHHQTVRSAGYESCMRRSVRLALAVLVVAAAVLPASLAAAFQGRPVYVVGDCLRAQVRPSKIIFTCADLGSYATGLHYLTY